MLGQTKTVMYSWTEIQQETGHLKNPSSSD